MGTESRTTRWVAGGVIGAALLVAVLAVVALLVFPAIQAAREAARRAQCLSNLDGLGLAFLNMERAQQRFPPSCHVERDADGNIVALDGWSWCVDLLPYMEEQALYDSLDTPNGKPLQPHPNPPAQTAADPHAKALATVIPAFHCPSFTGSEYVDATTKAEAITNYKAMGATHMESLNVASPNPTVPKYAPDSDCHPDGAIYPGSTHGTEGFKVDGTSDTILVVESVEQHVARWTVGNECTLVGLPPVVTFDHHHQYPYYHPTGYTANNYWGKSTIPPNINKTYLDWDYEKNPYNDGGLSSPSAAAKGPIRYGPSSSHPDVTNHLCADGSVHSISNQIDAGLYMFQITRNGGDPVPYDPHSL